MAIMVDTMLLVYALQAAQNLLPRSAEHYDAAQASYELLLVTNELYVSAITWFEIHRNVTEPQRGLLVGWEKRLGVLPVDARVAGRAAEIIDAARRAEVMCTKCLTVVKVQKCSKCGVQRSGPQRINDILVVATADASASVGTLYSFDNGVICLGDFVKQVRVLRPPSMHPPLSLSASGVVPASLP
jgi:predicted nucleic acid-binding protein